MAEATKATRDKQWEDLRKAFKDGAVGLLPKLSCSDCSRTPGKVCTKHTKAKCQTCGNWISTAHMHLDYVGHAAVTDRLNTVVGPENWSLDPIAFDSLGNPVVNHKGELWCRLTIFEASKICVGDGSTDAKQLIGDALRNGAMRFGVALDLWTKDELESQIDEPEARHERPSEQDATPKQVMTTPPVMGLTDEQIAEVVRLAKDKGYADKAGMVRFLNNTAKLDDFRKVPTELYERFKKDIIASGWSKDQEPVDLGSLPI